MATAAGDNGVKQAAEPLRFAFVLPMATGHLNPSLPLARCLVQLGHEVHYLSRESVRPAIETTGATFTDAAQVQVELYQDREQDIFGAFRSLCAEHGMDTAPMLVAMATMSPIHLELQLPGTIRWMERLRPHVVVFCPMMNPEGLYAAKYLKIPAVGLWTFAGPGGYVGCMNMFLEQSGIPLEEVAARAEAYQPMKDSMQRIAADYGMSFNFQDCFSPLAFQCTMCETDFNLVTTSEDFEDPCPPELARAYSDAGARFEYVGPLLGETGESAAEGLGASEAIDGAVAEVDPLRAAARARELGRAVVLASMGTILVLDTGDVGWNAVPRDGPDRPRKGLTGKQLCQAAWGAVFDAFGSQAEEEGPLLIVAIGRQPDALDGLDVPANAICLPYIPQVQLLEATDVFLTHGGQNSFMESLAAGVPVMVCPGFADQIVNSMKAEAMGVGLQVQRPVPAHGEEEAAAAAYRREVSLAVVRVLQEPQFREKAQGCKERLSRNGGVERARDLLVTACVGSYPRLLGHALNTPTDAPVKRADVVAAESSLRS